MEHERTDFILVKGLKVWLSVVLLNKNKCPKLESLSVQCLYISLSSQYRAPASQSNLRDLASPFCKATGRLENWDKIFSVEH